jgi:GNAT superfamily N-acetyltransferase
MFEAIDLGPVRDAEKGEIDRLAKIWYDGWRDAHATILPAALARFRTLESFEKRLGGLLPAVRVFGAAHGPVGFCITKGDELYQLFVSGQARGSGVAAALVADAEIQMAERGIGLAWLTCAIGNDRAARFYEKQGWRRAGVVVSELETPEGVFPLEVWRYEKLLRAAASDTVSPRG